LGKPGAVAIHRELIATHPELPIPSVRTIGRILERHGVIDKKKQLRHPAPPRAGIFLRLLKNELIWISLIL